jgi:hypothetical protein
LGELLNFLQFFNQNLHAVIITTIVPIFGESQKKQPMTDVVGCFFCGNDRSKSNRGWRLQPESNHLRTTIFPTTKVTKAGFLKKQLCCFL